MIKSRRMGWVGHVARMGEMRNTYKILVEILKGRDHSEDLGVDARIILKLDRLSPGLSVFLCQY
jgi:hypothetical protein